MAALAPAYGVVVGLLAYGQGLPPAGLLLIWGFATAVLGAPALIRGTRAFEFACWATAVVVLGSCLLPLWPAVLPLLLATSTLPLARHPWPIAATGAIVAAPLVWFGVAQWTS